MLDYFNELHTFWQVVICVLSVVYIVFCIGFGCELSVRFKSRGIKKGIKYYLLDEPLFIYFICCLCFPSFILGIIFYYLIKIFTYKPFVSK